MTTGYGINGLGLYSPLGNWGLGATGTYSSYDSYLNQMMGMNGSIMGMNGMYGMYGMYNPMFMAKWQQDYEASQLGHTARMQAGILDNEVAAYENTDSALMQKMATNGHIQQGIATLHQKIVEGDQNGICAEYDELKSYIYSTYRDEFAAKGSKTNPSEVANRYIDTLYRNMVPNSDGFISDVRKYGDSASANGFMQGFRPGHHNMYVEETLQHCLGLDIDQKESKDKDQKIMKTLGYTARIAEYGAYGFAAGAISAGVGLGLTKWLTPNPEKIADKNLAKAAKKALKTGQPANVPVDKTNYAKGLRYDIAKSIKTKKFGPAMKKAGNWGAIAAAALTLGDIIWKCSRD